MIEDSDLLAVRVAGTGVSSSLRVKHHRIARLAAAGAGPDEIADITGQDVETVAALLESTSMRGLVEEYRLEGADEDKMILRRARAAAVAGLSELHKRIETKPELLPSKILTELTLGLLDRTGTGPKGELRVGVFTLADLERLRSQDRVITVSAQASDPAGAALPEPVAEAQQVH